MIDWFGLILMLTFVKYLSRLKLNKLTYNLLFVSLLLTTLLANMLIVYEVCGYDTIRKLHYITNAIPFGNPLSWEMKSFVLGDKIRLCYYITLIASIGIILNSSSYDHKGLKKQIEKGCIKTMIAAIFGMMILYWFFYFEMDLSTGIVGKSLKYLYNTNIGIIVLELFILMVARDVGKILRVCVHFMNNKTGSL